MALLLPTPSSASDARIAIPTHVETWLHAPVVVWGRWMGGDTNRMIRIVIDHRIIDHRPPIRLILPLHKPAIASSPAMTLSVIDEGYIDVRVLQNSRRNVEIWRSVEVANTFCENM